MTGRHEVAGLGLHCGLTGAVMGDGKRSEDHPGWGHVGADLHAADAAVPDSALAAPAQFGSETREETSRDAKREAKRRAVLLTGARLFNDHGYEQTSLDDIATALNITKRTIYYYVDSKEDILFGCHLLGLEFLEETMARSADEDLPVLDRIAMLVRGYAAWVCTDLGASIAMVREQSLSPVRRSALRASKAEVDFQLRNLISLGVAEGRLKPCDPRLVAAAVFGALNWVPHWNRVENPVPPAVISIQYLQLIFNGVAIPDPSPD